MGLQRYVVDPGSSSSPENRYAGFKLAEEGVREAACGPVKAI